MRHIRQSDIAMELRRPHIREVRHKLQEALRYGGHDDAQRKYLQHQLNQLGKTRVYSTENPVLPGSINLGGSSRPTVEVQGETFEALSQYKFSELVRRAEELGIKLPEPTTKAQVVKILLAYGEPT